VLATISDMVPDDHDAVMDRLGRSLRWPALWLLLGIAAGVCVGIFTG